MSIHSKTRLLTHIVWSTRKHERMIPRQQRVALNTYFHDYADVHSMKVIVSYVNADHVHLLINVEPTQTVANVVKLLKGASSRWINNQMILPGKFSWGRGYGAFSVSESTAGRVINYINKQEEHHRIRPFEDEFKAFMSVYKIDAQNR